MIFSREKYSLDQFPFHRQMFDKALNKPLRSATEKKMGVDKKNIAFASFRETQRNFFYISFVSWYLLLSTKNNGAAKVFI